MVSLPFELPFKVILDWRYPTPHEQREKDRNTHFPLQKNTTLEKILLIRDRTCDLWFDRKSSAKKVMVQLWFGNMVKHLPV